ncbi:MAG: hypothetical protein P8170_18475, partial [Gemmatimonadota bacterium]
GSRLDVWGLVGGFGTRTACTLWAPVSLLGVAIAVMGAGPVPSEAGTVAAAIDVLRHADSPLPALRSAAIAGVPLGVALTALGVTSLTPWDPLVEIVNSITPTAAVLGALVVVLLVIGFFLSKPEGIERPGADLANDGYETRGNP